MRTYTKTSTQTKNARFRARRGHLVQLRSWGYTGRAAVAFAESHGWFGDTLAASAPSGRQYRGPAR